MSTAKADIVAVLYIGLDEEMKFLAETRLIETYEHAEPMEITLAHQRPNVLVLFDYILQVNLVYSDDITSLPKTGIVSNDLSEILLENKIQSGCKIEDQMFFTSCTAPKLNGTLMNTCIETSFDNTDEYSSSKVKFSVICSPEAQLDCQSVFRFEDINEECTIPPPKNTTIDVLSSQLECGQISQRDYTDLIKRIVASVIPRNLSDLPATARATGTRAMYAWQIPCELSVDKDQISEKLLRRYNSESSLYQKYHACASYLLGRPRAVSLDSYCYKDTQRQALCFTHFGFDERMKTPIKNKMIDLDLTSNFVFCTLNESPNLPPITISQHFEPNTHLTIPDGMQCYNNASSIKGELQTRAQRSSSLKSERKNTKTQERKIVRFADAYGLDLVTVRQVINQEDPPRIPASATLDLNLDSERSLSSIGAKHFQLGFTQPSASPAFLHRVLSQIVCLENACVDAARHILMGTVRVRDMGFEKRIFVRITYNNWSTFCDIPAAYVQGSHDGVTDRFSFSIVIPNTIVVHDRLIFAVRYESHAGKIYWDNNDSENYIISCYAKATDMAGDGSWIHYL